MIIFDLDGTLRDPSCADHMVPKNVNLAANWREWQTFVNEHGEPIKNACELYTQLVEDNDDVVIFTSSQFGTKCWLDKFNLPQPSQIIERKTHDNRASFDYKSEMIQIYASHIDLWVDDHQGVCDFAESKGIKVINVNHVTESKWEK